MRAHRSATDQTFLLKRRVWRWSLGIPSSSRLVQYVPFVYRGVSPATLDQRPVLVRRSPEIIRRRTFARYHGQGGASDGSKMTITNQAGCPPTWRIFTILLLICEFAAAANTQPFVVSNSEDNQISKDFFVGPCLVNTNQTCPMKK